MRIVAACVMALAPCWIPVQVAEPDQMPEIDCKKAFSTPAVEICAERDYWAADQRLNKAYSDVAASIDTDSAAVPVDVQTKWHTSLIDAQRKWVAYRDAECTLTGYEWYGGSGRAAFYTICMTDLTNLRIEALQHHTHPH